MENKKTKRYYSRPDTPLIVVENRVADFSYKRFVKKVLTNHILADADLDSDSVEMFRIDPDWFLNYSNEPDAA